jgi:hypothetical protein
LTLSVAAIELEAVAGERKRAAVALRDGGTLLVPADLPQPTEGCVEERVVASVEALLRVARNRPGMVSAVER